jgi:outer membrane biosynthesis protein TonB
VDPAEPVPVTPPTEPSTPAPEPSEPADPEPAPSEPAPTPSDPAVPAPAPTQPEEPGDSGDDETGEHAGTPKPTTAPGNSAWAHANAAEHRAAGQANADLHRNAGHREGGDEREHSGTTATTDAGHGDHGKGHDK